MINLSVLKNEIKITLKWVNVLVLLDPQNSGICTGLFMLAIQDIHLLTEKINFSLYLIFTDNNINRSSEDS